MGTAQVGLLCLSAALKGHHAGITCKCSNKGERKRERVREEGERLGWLGP